MAEAISGTWNVEIDGAEGAFACRDDQNLLVAMISARRTDIKIGCRNGGCGICRVRIARGAYQSQKMTRSRISESDEQQGIVLACRIMPQSDIAVTPLPLMPRKGAGA